jgi:uncharacterized repeat protein (TIGR04076 family)
MAKVKLTIIESHCRCGYCKKDEIFLVEDLCPPICHELWHSIYPSVYTLLNGGSLDYKTRRETMFDAECPDEGRVKLHGERLEE